MNSYAERGLVSGISVITGLLLPAIHYTQEFLGNYICCTFSNFIEAFSFPLPRAPGEGGGGGGGGGTYRMVAFRVHRPPSIIIFKGLLL